MQERSHAFAMKSQIWLLDPRPNLPAIVAAVKAGFELSEASRTPVMLELRIRACHVHGQLHRDGQPAPPFTLAEAMATPARDVNRIALPPMSYAHEREKIERALAGGGALHRGATGSTSSSPSAAGSDIGIVVQGGHCNTVLRALERLGLADVYGRSQIPVYVMNVAYPVIDGEVLRFCAGKRAVLMVEEGQPNFIEQSAGDDPAPGRRADAALHGKDLLPLAGEYTRRRGARRRARASSSATAGSRRAATSAAADAEPHAPLAAPATLAADVHGAAARLLHRLPGAADLQRDEAGRARARRASRQRRHRLPPVLDPAAVPPRQHDDGLRPRHGRRVGVQRAGARADAPASARSASWATAASGTTA